MKFFLEFLKKQSVALNAVLGHLGLAEPLFGKQKKYLVYKVTKSILEKFSSKKIKIKLTEDLRQEDGIKFFPSDKGMIVNFLYNERGALVNSAKKGEIVFLDNKVNLIEKDKVQKTIDKELIDHLQKLKKKKIPISMVVTITKENFKLMIQDEKNKVFLQDRICEIAKNRRTTKEEIIEKLSRLGDTPFVLKKINVFLEENLFLPVSKLNEIRRQGVELLIEKRIKIDRN